jgi:DNA-binding IclR family transcriptional regulator
MPASEHQRRGTQLISKSATLLRMIANANHQGARLVDLTHHSGFDRSTVRRILQGLVEEGLVRQLKDGRRYFLGPLLFELGLAAAHGYDLPRIAAPSLERIARETGDTVYLVQRSGLDAVCIARREGDFPIKVLTIEVGTRRPLGAAGGGLAILMSLPADERTAILQKNQPQMEYYEQLYGIAFEEAVQDALHRGFALMPINVLPYTSAVGVCVPISAGSAQVALSVSALSSRIMDDQRYLSISALLKEEAEKIAAQLATT